MTAEIATLERVRNAAEGLRKKDIRVTADRVIDLIGGGSKGTFLDHLRTLRDAGPKDDETPTAVFEMARGALGDVYRSGREAEAERTRVATERLSSIVADLDAQVAELATDIARLHVELVERKRRMTEMEEEAADMRSRLASADETNVALRAEAASERDSAAANLREALARFEVLIAEATSARAPRRESGKGTAGANVD